MERTATSRSVVRACSTSRPISVDFPTPGGPVKPTMAACPVFGYTSRTSAHPSGSSFSTSEMARASARLSPASRRSARSAAVRPEAAMVRRILRSAQVLPDVPGPELDQVVVGVGHVAGAPGALELDLLDLLAQRAQALDRGVEVRFRDVHGEVHVRAAAASEQPDLRLPEADPGALAGHHPYGVAIGPAVHHGQPQHL